MRVSIKYKNVTGSVVTGRNRNILSNVKFPASVIFFPKNRKKNNRTTLRIPQKFSKIRGQMCNKKFGISEINFFSKIDESYLQFFRFRNHRPMETINRFPLQNRYIGIRASGARVTEFSPRWKKSYFMRMPTRNTSNIVPI